MNVRDKKGSITIFVLVGLLFMTGFLIISFGSNVNKSKSAKEQFNIMSSIYSRGDGDAKAYERAYTDIRRRNDQILTDYSENSSTLELTKTFTDTLSNYKIYGNSVQNGTPSPTNPVEVESVGNLKTNLFSLKGREVRDFGANSAETLRTFTGNGIYIGVHQSNIYSQGNINTYTIDVENNKVIFNPKTAAGIGFDFKVEPNTAYTFKTASENNYVAITQYTENGEYILNSIHQESVTITTTSETKWIVAILAISGNQQIGIEYAYSDIQLEQATSATPYDKLGKYEIPIRVSSLNLFNFDNIKNTSSSAGMNVDYNNKTFALPAASNMYTIGESFTGAPTAYEKFNQVLNISGAGYYCLKVKVNSEVTNIEPRAAWILHASIGQPKLITHTYKNGYYFVKFQITDEIIENLKTSNTFRMYLYAFRTKDTKENVDVTISDIMFVKGDYTIDTMPEYQANAGEIVTKYIYLDQPLRRVGDYADYIDFSNQKVYRNVGQLTDISNLNWMSISNYFQAVLGFNINTENRASSLCNYFKYGNAKDDKAFWFDSSGTGIRIVNADYTDVNSLKENLEKLDINIIYPLQTSVEEILIFPELKTYEDYTKIELLTEVAPSKIEATYYGYTME